MGFLKKNKSILVLLGILALAVVLDLVIASTHFVEKSPYFDKNDYEKLVEEHDGNTVFDQALYGNSAGIYAYAEELSNSDYANISIVYGTVCDLEGMLEKNYVTVNQDLVLMLNYFTLMDDLDTNDTYPWYRGVLEPYVFFQGKRITTTINNCVNQLVTEGNLKNLPNYDGLRRQNLTVMTQEEMEERLVYHKEHYWNLDLSHYQKNLQSLQNVIDYCADHGIRLRVLIPPENPAIENPVLEEGTYPQQVMAEAERILTDAGIEVNDLSGTMEPEDFADSGHMYYETGTPKFTAMIEEWLMS